ncbi:MAG TPA: hypothetical protein VFN13_06560 [Rudaea sp.]|nr:hypothetical protein [Rudaea sp.]
MNRTIFLTGLLATTLGAVATAAAPAPETTPTTTAVAASQPADPVFDCYRMNSAWGFVMAGAMIDSRGAIFSYRVNGKPWAPMPQIADGMHWLDAAQLRAKFTNAKPDGSVDAKSLQENTALISSAALGKISSADTGVRDAGTSTCHAYIHDANGKRFQDIQLGSDGGVADTRQANSAPAAKTLLTWLTSVGVAKK